MRRCLQVTCHLRLNGNKVDTSLLVMFDSQIRSAISASFTRDLPDHIWWQATTGVLFGGLGFCTAQSVVLPAFIASRLVSRPSRAIPRRPGTCQRRSQVWMVSVEDRDDVAGHCERRQSDLCRQRGANKRSPLCHICSVCDSRLITRSEEFVGSTSCAPVSGTHTTFWASTL